MQLHVRMLSALQVRKEMSQPLLHKTGYFPFSSLQLQAFAAYWSSKSFLNTFYGAVWRLLFLSRSWGFDRLENGQTLMGFFNAGLLALANLIIFAWVWVMCMFFYYEGLLGSRQCLIYHTMPLLSPSVKCGRRSPPLSLPFLPFPSLPSFLILSDHNGIFPCEERNIAN